MHQGEWTGGDKKRARGVRFMRGILSAGIAAVLVSSVVIAGPIVSMPGPVDVEGTQSRRQLWLIPSTDPSVLMRTTVFRPPGDGPFPLVVMNHGTTQNPVQRQYFPILEFEAAALWFAKQGFVVAAPQRPGHGETGGVFLEDQANCVPSDFLNAGRAGAANIQSAIDYMTTWSDNPQAAGTRWRSPARTPPWCGRASSSKAAVAAISTENRTIIASPITS